VERAGADGGMFDSSHMGMDLMPIDHEERMAGASGSRSKRYAPPPPPPPPAALELFEYACKQNVWAPTVPSQCHFIPLPRIVDTCV